MKCLLCMMEMQSTTTATLSDTVAKSIVLTLGTNMITDSLLQHTKMICKECGATLEGYPSITLSVPYAMKEPSLASVNESLEKRLTELFIVVPVVERT